MDEIVRQAMMLYYDERAGEYDQVYFGKRPASIPNADIYVSDTKMLCKTASGFGFGHLVDIGCGTCFWLPYYARNCDRITLIDQSSRMLAECRKRISHLSPPLSSDHFTIIQADAKDLDLGEEQFDTCFLGFVVGHLFPEEEMSFFKKITRALKNGGGLLIFDSAWNELRKRIKKQEGVYDRVLNDGRHFKIYKKYFDQDDINFLFRKYSLRLENYYEGKVFIAAEGVCLK